MGVFKSLQSLRCNAISNTNMFSKKGAKLNINKILSKKDASNNYKMSLPHTERKTSTTNKQLPSLDEKRAVSNEKVNSSSFFQKTLATIKSVNDKNEAIKLVKEDDVKRRIKDARNFFGNKIPKFECYSITNIDPSSESLRIAARHVSYENSAENNKTLIESSQQEKKVMFCNADTTNLSQNVSLEKENIKISNTSSNLISIEKMDNVQKEMIPISLDQMKLSKQSNSLETDNIFLIIDRKIENASENNEIDHATIITLKETIYLLKGYEAIRDTLTLEKKEKLKNSSVVVIERFVTYSKSDRTGKFEKIVKKGKMIVREAKASAKAILNEELIGEVMATEQNMARNEASDAIPEYSLLEESVNLTSLSSIIAVKA